MEKQFRFCSACGYIGNVPKGYLSCCPEGHYSKIYTEEEAKKLRMELEETRKNDFSNAHR